MCNGMNHNDVNKLDLDHGHGRAFFAFREASCGSHGPGELWCLREPLSNLSVFQEEEEKTSYKIQPHVQPQPPDPITKNSR